MFLGEIVFLTVCLSVYGLVNVAINYRTTIPFDNSQRLGIHGDLLDLVSRTDGLLTEMFPFLKPHLWLKPNLFAFEAF